MAGTLSPMLEMHGIVKSFGPTHALRGVSLSVEPGQVVALIGENGAGKSTLMKLLSGAHPFDAGTMLLDGRPYLPNNPMDARRSGVAMIYQELNLAKDLSVEDNIMLGQEELRCGWVLRRKQRERVREALNLLGHSELSPEKIVRHLSIGAQQLVEIARALVSHAKVMIFDEPTSSLPKSDVERLFTIIQRLRDQGMAVVYISHFLEEVRSIASRFVILRDGQSVNQGELTETADREIISMMAGRGVDTLFPKVPHSIGDVVLRVKSLTGSRLPTDVSFDVRRGEIFGLFGLVGAGRTETLRHLFGLDAKTKGQVHWRNNELKRSPQQSIRCGLGFLSEDRKGEGLAQGLSIADNLTLSRLAPYAQFGVLKSRRRQHSVNDWISRLSVKARGGFQSIAALSGGNQQKVAIARVLHQGAELLLFDEPTRGIDVRTKADIYQLMGEQAAEGKSIVFVSSYLPELLAVCDTIGVMGRGRIRGIRPADQWTEQEIIATAISTNG
jgi:ribose transport system ATP-binding protein